MVDEGIFCRKKECGSREELGIHHLVPKSLCEGGMADKYTRKRLCKKHHDILHGLYLPIIFSYVPDETKEECRLALEGFAIKWINKEID